MLQGPDDPQPVAPASIDRLQMMDVIEHLPDPVGTLGHCARLLKPDGILIVQTPEYPDGQSLKEMNAAGATFVQHLKPQEHLYLLSRRASVELMSASRAGSASRRTSRPTGSSSIEPPRSGASRASSPSSADPGTSRVPGPRPG